MENQNKNRGGEAGLKTGPLPSLHPLRAMTPGRWARPYPLNPHVWEDPQGNRAIVHHTINGVTVRRSNGEAGFLFDHDQPMRTALKRNPSRRRAGLAAARIFFSPNVEARQEGRTEKSLITIP